ncbi:DUF2380 domain-containing protein [Methylomonas methanica]|nr:DUF2380 domain-containing protein [Methylomonas methanica]
MTAFSAAAKPRIAVLEVELNDATLQANTPAEQQRTASMRRLLERALAQSGQYEMIAIDVADQAAANAGFGYLFAHDDAAAELGRQFGADWVLVGQHGKPSFLYSHLKIHVIQVKSRTLAARYSIELKGNNSIVTQRSVNKLAAKIQAFIAGKIAMPE